MREKERGNTVLTFVIISVILAVVLVGAVYFLKQRSDQVRQDQVTSETKQEEKEPEPEAEGAEELEKTEESKEPADEADESATYFQPEATPPTASSNVVPQVDQLSTTGPEDSLLNIIAIFALTTATGAYFASRRKSSNTF